MSAPAPDLPELGPCTRLILVRHTEPDEAARGLCYGSTDVALSAAGRAHALELAARLAPLSIDAVLASPRRRTVATAEPIAGRHGLCVELVGDLREMDFGALEGRRYDDIAATMPELWHRWMTSPTEVRFPDGESYGDLRTRATAAMDAALGAYRSRTVLAVTHGGVVRALLASTLGMPDAHLFRLDQRYGALTVIDWYDDGTPVVRLVNG